jgi:hypothetical protein
MCALQLQCVQSTSLVRPTTHSSVALDEETLGSTNTDPGLTYQYASLGGSSSLDLLCIWVPGPQRRSNVIANKVRLSACIVAHIYMHPHILARPIES